MIFVKTVMMQEASQFKKGETVVRVNYSDFSSRNDQQYALIYHSFILYTGSYMFRQ
jgi:hypothetical protein